MIDVVDRASYTLCSMRPPAVNSCFFLHNMIPSHGGTNPHSAPQRSNRTDGRSSDIADQCRLFGPVKLMGRLLTDQDQAQCGMSVTARISSHPEISGYHGKASPVLGPLRRREQFSGFGAVAGKAELRIFRPC
jgi:hypothetical protein